MEEVTGALDGSTIIKMQGSKVIPDNSMVKDLIVEGLAAAVEVVHIDKKTVTVQVWLHEGGKWTINKSYRLKLHEKALIQARQTGFRPHEPSGPASPGNNQ